MQRRLSIVLLCAVMIAGAASYVVYRLSGGGQKAVKPAAGNSGGSRSTRP